jgi:hypothetical protein
VKGSLACLSSSKDCAVGGQTIKPLLKTSPVCNVGCTLLSCFLQQCEDKWGHLCALADFSLALTESIQEINKHSFNNFELRIGELQLEVEASLGQVSLFYQLMGVSPGKLFFLQNT